ncbi:hypothetical protein P389DRAFT_67222 [Cystobasidium minutum MCA 4210]|uniref:uncharacterized protein n=1 Tax=Cystobasidium minutum MCA 4210 TaxID=1397322 RepID=UPI0034CF42C5|eukprot:jgi/Rhomi1/67222/CE67221_1449
MNPEYLAQSLLADSDFEDGREDEPALQPPIPHDYVLLARLPPLSRLREEAAHAAIVSAEHTVISMSMQEALEDDLEQPDPATLARQRSASETSVSRVNSSTVSTKSPVLSKLASGSTTARKRPYEPHDVYRAIDRKDLATLFDIRDNAFHLLVQKLGEQTPLLYASRLGKNHRDIPILITGALSRFVNNLPDDVSKVDSQMSGLIRAVRANLKLAIDASLNTNQTDLISSYLQIIIMSEGEKWIWDQTQNVALALRAGKSARPVKTARTAVTNFATKQLRQLDKGNALASVEDYVANASCDLVMMGLWSLVTDKLGGSMLPSYQFSRDERIFKSFSDSINSVSNKLDYSLKLNKSIRSAIETTITIMEKRATGHPEKARLLAEALDAPS